MTKATEQVLLMVSDEHLNKFAWTQDRAEAGAALERAEAEDKGESDDEGDMKRIFSFEVSQSEEVDDKRITVRDGFTVSRFCN